VHTIHDNIEEYDDIDDDFNDNDDEDDIDDNGGMGNDRIYNDDNHNHVVIQF
jgi:hypothetical protein